MSRKGKSVLSLFLSGTAGALTILGALFGFSWGLSLILTPFKPEQWPWFCWILLLPVFVVGIYYSTLLGALVGLWLGGLLIPPKDYVPLGFSTEKWDNISEKEKKRDPTL